MNSPSYALTASEIINNSADISKADDIVSKIRYIIKEDEKKVREHVINRIWKNYKGENGIKSKTLLFHEYPPEFGDTSFLSWNYTKKARKSDNHWIYIPIIGRISKLSLNKKSKIFEGLEINAVDFNAQDMDALDYTLLKEDVMDNTDYYVIESRTDKGADELPYGNIIYWISKDEFLKKRIEFYDKDDMLIKIYNIKWTEIDTIWLWEEVHSRNYQNNNETTIKISDIQINKGFKDFIFSEKGMTRGYENVLSTVN